jgi:hypothetical protein
VPVDRVPDPDLENVVARGRVPGGEGPRRGRVRADRGQRRSRPRDIPTEGWPGPGPRLQRTGRDGAFQLLPGVPDQFRAVRAPAAP